MKAKKHLGQNFLTNQQIVQKIIAAAAIRSNDQVVEVGPGMGILTKALCEKAQKVTAIELDGDLIANLHNLTNDYPNLVIIHADALKTSLPSNPYKLVANIPYYITSPLLNHFLQPKTSQEMRPLLMVLMVQKEVAEKVCAKTGDHSVLSLQVQIFGKPELVGVVGKGNFLPQPKVDSAILTIEVYQEPLIQDTETFFKIIKAAFSQKRKTLLNSLQNGLKISKKEVIEILQKADISETERPQNLDIEQWKRLTSVIGEDKMKVA